MALTTEELWKRFSTELRFFIASRVRDPVLTEDILHDIFLKVHTHLGDLKDKDRLRAWIYRITRNAIIDHYRRCRPAKEPPPAFVSEADPGERVRVESHEWLLAMIRNLPEHYQEAIALSEIEEVSHKEIARRTGTSISCVKSRVQRGRAMLKQMILDCCRLEFDSRGTPIDYECKTTGCGECNG